MHYFMSKKGIIKNCNLLTPVTKEGTELSFVIGENNELCKIIVNKYKKQENDDKWSLGSIPQCGPFAHFRMDWTLIKLGENETLTSNITKYNEHIDPEVKLKLTNEKKNYICHHRKSAEK